MSATVINLTEQQIEQINTAASALADGMITGIKEFGSLSNITESTFFRLSTTTALLGTVSNALESGQYTKAWLQGYLGAFSAEAATRVLPLVVADPPVALGVAVAAAASYLGNQVGALVYDNAIAPNIDLSALGNSIAQAISVTAATRGITAVLSSTQNDTITVAANDNREQPRPWVPIGGRRRRPRELGLRCHRSQVRQRCQRTATEWRYRHGT